MAAKIYDRMNNKLEATKKLEEAAIVNPRDHTIFLTLAGFYFQIGKQQEAVESLKRVMALAPHSEEAKFAANKLKEIENQIKKEKE